MRLKRSGASDGTDRQTNRITAVCLPYCMAGHNNKTGQRNLVQGNIAAAQPVSGKIPTSFPHNAPLRWEEGSGVDLDPTQNILGPRESADHVGHD